MSNGEKINLRGLVQGETISGKFNYKTAKSSL